MLIMDYIQKIQMKYRIYRISANSFRKNYSFLKVEVRKVFEGGNYSKEETINFLFFCDHLI